MASQTELKILLSKGPLIALWNDKALKADSNIAINNGQLYIGLGDNNRAMLFIDDNGIRHPFTADVAWDDIRNLPTNLATTNDINAALTTVANTYLPLAGGTLTGTLWMDTTSTPFIIGKNEKIGMRASNSSNFNLGQINISNAWWQTGNQWGAQISAYDGIKNKYNQIRVSHEGLQYIVYNNASGNEEKKFTLSYNEQTESLDFTFDQGE